MWKKVLAVVGVLVVAAIAFISSRPDTYRVERSLSMAAPADVVFTRLNSFKSWDAWSPWSKLDPAMKIAFEGPEAGVGAKYIWDSQSNDVGAGDMTITGSTPPEKVVIDLHFSRPFDDRSVTTFMLKPAADQTTVTWAMDGHHNFMSKAMCLFMDMDAMIGGDFEKGLASLKTLTEADAKKRADEEAAKKAAEVAAAAAAPTPAAEPTATP